MGLSSVCQFLFRSIGTLSGRVQNTIIKLRIFMQTSTCTKIVEKWNLDRKFLLVKYRSDYDALGILSTFEFPVNA